MKTPRFIKEYANWRIKQIKMESDSVSEKDRRIERIEKVVRHCIAGMITIDDAMRIILRA